MCVDVRMLWRICVYYIYVWVYACHDTCVYMMYVCGGCACSNTCMSMMFMCGCVHATAHLKLEDSVVELIVTLYLCMGPGD